MANDAHYMIGEAHPADFGVKDIRVSKFRQLYGPPLPESVSRLPRSRQFTALNDDDDDGEDFGYLPGTGKQLSIPGAPKYEDHVIPHGDMGVYDSVPDGAIPPDHENRLAFLHASAEEGFADAQDGGSTPNTKRHMLPAPTHEAEYGDYILSRHTSVGGDVIQAWHQAPWETRHVGGIQFSNPGEEVPGRVVHSLLYVDPAHQHKGLAGAMSRFAQFTHPGDPIKGMGVSGYRTPDGTGFASAATGMAVSPEGITHREDVQNAMVDPNNDPRAKRGAEFRRAQRGTQLPLF